jgi:hypothetical protein
MCYHPDMFQNFRNLITFPKMSHLLRYSIGNPKNFPWSSKKSWKIGIFWSFFQVQCIITLRSCKLQV